MRNNVKHTLAGLLLAAALGTNTPKAEAVICDGVDSPLPPSQIYSAPITTEYFIDPPSTQKAERLLGYSALGAAMLGVVGVYKIIKAPDDYESDSD